MRSTSMKCSLAMVFLVVLTLTAAPASAREPDAWITMKVKTQLILSPSVGGLRIDVDTNDGIVTLHGNVSSDAERDEAKGLAAAVRGVRTVRDFVQVVPDSRRKAVKRSDDRVRAEVKRALKEQRRLSNSSIDVRSVNLGLVMLGGRAETMSEHLLAIAVADRVEGVRRVASEIEGPDTLGDREVWFDEAAPDKENSTLGDAWITAKTKFRLMTHPDVPAGDINVDTFDGTVTLFGTAASSELKQESERVARDVSGVKDVRNLLIVIPPKDEREATLEDDALAASIRQRLSAAGFEGSTIHVEVKARVARLTGTVKRPIDRYDAAVIAGATEGIRGVRDDLRWVGRPN